MVTRGQVVNNLKYSWATLHWRHVYKLRPPLKENSREKKPCENNINPTKTKQKPKPNYYLQQGKMGSKENAPCERTTKIHIASSIWPHKPHGNNRPCNTSTSPSRIHARIEHSDMKLK